MEEVQKERRPGEEEEGEQKEVRGDQAGQKDPEPEGSWKASQREHRWECH